MTNPIAMLDRPIPTVLDKEAFCAWAERQDDRFELVDGRTVMMVGFSRGHGLICTNLMLALRSRLDPQRWDILSEFGVDVGPNTLRFADLAVDPVGGNLKDRTARAPVLIAEVLSPTTAALDLGDKAAEYLRLPSLVAYLVLSQEEPKAYAWIRGPEGFEAGPLVVAGLDARIGVAPLGIEIPLSEIYAGILPA